MGATVSLQDPSNSPSNSPSSTVGRKTIKEPNIYLRRSSTSVAAEFSKKINLVRPTYLAVPTHESFPFVHYRYGPKLGEGYFNSLVFQGVPVKNGPQVAIKEVHLSALDKNKLIDLRYEMFLLSQLKHDSIISLKSVYMTTKNSEKLFMIVGLLNGGDLLNTIVKQDVYSENDVKRFMLQLVSAVSYLHSRGVVHSNICLENLILETPSFYSPIKLVNFHFARCVNVKPRAGSLASLTRHPMTCYVSPEQQLQEFELRKAQQQAQLSRSGSFIQRSNSFSGLGNSLGGSFVGRASTPAPMPVRHVTGFDTTSEVWSVGVIMHILLAGFYPFDLHEEEIDLQLMDNLPSLEERPFDIVSGGAKKLLRKILCVDPQERYTAEKILLSSYLIPTNASDREEYRNSRSNDHSPILESLFEDQGKYAGELPLAPKQGNESPGKIMNKGILHSSLLRSAVLKEDPNLNLQTRGSDSVTVRESDSFGMDHTTAIPFEESNKLESKENLDFKQEQEEVQSHDVSLAAEALSGGLLGQPSPAKNTGSQFVGGNDLTGNLQYLQSFTKNYRITHTALVSSGILKFRKTGRYQQEKRMLSF